MISNAHLVIADKSDLNIMDKKFCKQAEVLSYMFSKAVDNAKNDQLISIKDKSRIKDI